MVSGIVNGFDWGAPPAAGERGTVPAGTKGGPGKGFGEILRDALASVNRLQVEAERHAEALATGEAADLHSVMIATAKADLALQLTLQVRNRVIEAYQEISRMQV